MTNVYNRKLSALTIKVTEALKYSTTLLPIDFLFEKFVSAQKLTTFAINFEGNTATLQHLFQAVFQPWHTVMLYPESHDKKHLRSCVDLESFEPPLIRTVEVIIIFCTFCLLEIIAISPSVVDVIKASQISL